MSPREEDLALIRRVRRGAAPPTPPARLRRSSQMGGTHHARLAAAAGNYTNVASITKSEGRVRDDDD
jgi:hypothetical protein